MTFTELQEFLQKVFPLAEVIESRGINPCIIIKNLVGGVGFKNIYMYIKIYDEGYYYRIQYFEKGIDKPFREIEVKRESIKNYFRQKFHSDE